VWGWKYSFESIDDTRLQNNCVQFVVMDKETITSDKIIGQAIVELSPLLQRIGQHQEGISRKTKGWYPLSDSAKGFRGELEIEISLTFLMDENKATSIYTSKVQFFSTEPPPYLMLKANFGFIEELVTFKID